MTSSASSPRADIVVACADAEGRIRGVYASSSNLFWNRTAPVGSIAKLFGAVALGQRDRPETKYCRAPIPGVAGSDTGDSGTCRRPENWITARDAFAQSDNKAIHWALRRVPPRMLASIATSLGLPSLADTPPATALTIGTFELTPAEMLRLVATIGAGLAGSEAKPIHLVEELIILDNQGQTHKIRYDGAAAADVRRIFTPAVKSFARSVLRATSEENGTLRALGPLRERLSGELYAKTGTVSVAGRTQDIHIAGTYMRHGKPWSFVVTVGSSSNAVPLGTRLLAGRFAPLAAVAVCRQD